MAGIRAEHAQHDATLRTMALGTLILNAFSIRAAGTRPLHTVPLQCPPKQYADKYRRRDPTGVVVDRKASQTCEVERNAGCHLIAPRRSSSAHLRRPWRAKGSKA